MKEDYYQNRDSYGMGHTRLKRIMELVPLRKQKILDVGCSDGRLGQKLKVFGNEVHGVEISQKAANMASRVLDKVYIFDIEKKWPGELLKEKFDLIIMAEILEHLFDPSKVLEQIVQLLNEKGEIIITTPNFLFWFNRIKFLFGSFQYKREGMFDFGHIRFFTRQYLKEILIHCRLGISEEKNIIFPGKMTFLLKYWPNLFASQFIVRVKKI